MVYFAKFIYTDNHVFFLTPFLCYLEASYWRLFTHSVFLIVHGAFRKIGRAEDPISRKKIKIQLAHQLSKLYELLARGFPPLSQPNTEYFGWFKLDTFRSHFIEWLRASLAGKLVEKVACPNTKSSCPRQPNGGFLEPWIHTLSPNGCFHIISINWFCCFCSILCCCLCVCVLYLCCCVVFCFVLFFLFFSFLQVGWVEIVRAGL